MEIGSTLVHIRNSIRKVWAHSSVWIEWLPAEQLVEGSNPSGPVLSVLFYLDDTIMMGQMNYVVMAVMIESAEA